MADIENHFSSLVSIIKVEPEEFQTSEGILRSNSDAVLRRKAKIFSDPAVFLERVTLKNHPPVKISRLEKKKKEKSFVGYFVLKLAEKGNDGKKWSEPHACCLCEKVFRDRSSLKVHLMNFHEKAPEMFCDLCPKTFRAKKLITHHMKNHLKKAYFCNICDFKTAHRNSFDYHKKTHLKQEKCKICNKQVASLQNHLQTHRKVKCPICKKLFSQNNLKSHVKTHDSSKYKCSGCNSTFSTKGELRSHELEHHYEGKIHRCHCGSVFKAKWKLNEHQSCHGDGEITCKVCKRKFNYNHSLKSHWKKYHSKTHGSMISSKVVNRSGPFICDKCEKSFDSRDSFRNHFHYTHLIEPTFPCDLCPKSFKYKYSLEDHMRSQHSKVNPFTCKICGHKSTTKGSLKKHMLQHGPKEECKVCHKKVANMYDHMRHTHVKVKCRICGKSSSKRELARHIKKMHVPKNR